MTPLIIGLPYDHLHPSGSRQFADKKLLLLGDGLQIIMVAYKINCVYARYYTM
jgi:hypothetical protein